MPLIYGLGSLARGARGGYTQGVAMRYWIYDEEKKAVLGPHLLLTLRKLPGFGPETKVAPEGARAPKDWKRAKEFPELVALFPPPSAPPAP